MTDLKSSAENCNSKSNIVEKELADRKKGYFKSHSQSNIKNNNNEKKTRMKKSEENPCDLWDISLL